MNEEETGRAAQNTEIMLVVQRSTCGEGCSDKVEGLMPGNALHQVHLHTNNNPATSAVVLQFKVLCCDYCFNNAW